MVEVSGDRIRRLLALHHRLKLCTNMRAEDVTNTLDLALKASGCGSATVLPQPRLLSDNGPSYIAEELAEYIDARNMSHVRDAPMHPQTQGKIERWHQTLMNRILLENHFLPSDLEAQIEAFVEQYNYRRYYESLDNVTPADAYFGRAPAIIKKRERPNDRLGDLDQMWMVGEKNLGRPCDLGQYPETGLSPLIIEIHEEVIRQERQAVPAGGWPTGEAPGIEAQFAEAGVAAMLDTGDCRDLDGRSRKLPFVQPSKLSQRTTASSDEPERQLTRAPREIADV